MLERRPSHLARYRRSAAAAAGALIGGAAGLWLDRGLTGGGWSVPLTGLVAGGALLAVAEAVTHWVGRRLRRAAEDAEAKPPFARLTPRPGVGRSERRRRRGAQPPRRGDSKFR